MPPVIQSLLTTFDVAYQGKFGMRYPFVGGKDAKLMQGLLKLYTVPQIESFIAAYFESEDEFIAGSGYSFGAFKGCLPKLIAAVQRPAKPDMNGHVPPCESVTACIAKVISDGRALRAVK